MSSFKKAVLEIISQISLNEDRLTGHSNSRARIINLLVEEGEISKLDILRKIRERLLELGRQSYDHHMNVKAYTLS